LGAVAVLEDLGFLCDELKVAVEAAVVAVGVTASLRMRVEVEASWH